MKRIKSIIVGALAVVSLLVAPVVLSTSSVSAVASPKESACKGSGGMWSGTACTYAADRGTTDINVLIKNVVSILSFVIGAAAVIMIVIGGIRYTTSGGDAGQAKSAKDTILYAVIGIVVAFMAYAIVNFVMGNI